MKKTGVKRGRRGGKNPLPPICKTHEERVRSGLLLFSISSDGKTNEKTGRRRGWEEITAQAILDLHSDHFLQRRRKRKKKGVRGGMED